MCEKIITQGPAKTIDPCLVAELETIQTPYFNDKFQILMSCCGHGKYPKTLIVQNRFSKCIFEWFSGIILSGTERAKNREPFYERDDEGYYFIPEIETGLGSTY